jgi:hypothetical protein
MWQEMPDQQLNDINLRHATLIEEAASDRFASRRQTTEKAHFTRLRVRVGALLIVVGCSLCEDEALANHSAH